MDIKRWDRKKVVLLVLVLLAIPTLFLVAKYNWGIFADIGMPRAPLTNIQNEDGWTATCKTFAQNSQPVDGNLCKSLISRESSRLKIDSQKSYIVNYAKKVQLEPNTKYKISFKLKIKDRQTYYFMDVPDIDDPDPPTWLIPDPTGSLSNKGIWGGTYSVGIDETDLTPVEDYKLPRVVNSDVDWFPISSYFKSKDDGLSSIKITLKGYEGLLYVDELNIEKVASYVADKYLNQTIDYSFDSMAIKSASASPPKVETNAASFEFTDNKIISKKDGTVVSETLFPDQFLSGLTLSQKEGLAIFSNQNITLSVGSDSTIIARLNTAAPQVSVSSSTVGAGGRGYHAFEAGVIFATDYEKGVLFSPIRSKQETYQTKTMSQYNADTGGISYTDPDPEQRNWNVSQDFSQQTWIIEYNFVAGDGFVSEVFPPKKSDLSRICSKQMDFTSVNPNNNPDNYSYNIQYFKNHYNTISLTLQGIFSSNSTSPELFYYTDSNDPKKLVPSKTPNAVKHLIEQRQELAGPYNVKAETKESLKKFIREAHESGLKVIVYVAPRYYHTDSSDLFLNNLDKILTEFSLDGAYFDGIYDYSLLEDIYFVRKTRNLFKDKFYAQHSSWTRSAIFNSINLRVPVIDAYADLLWVGENSKQASDDIWRLTYSGKNVSNTASALLPEYRPVDYSDKQKSLGLTLSPQEQINKSLSFDGLFRILPNSNSSYIQDKKYNAKTYFDSEQEYWDKLNEKCLPTTQNNGKCDIGENVLNSPKDCLDSSKTPEVAVSGETKTCQTTKTVAQWILDGTPYYALHYSFDTKTARDDSENGNLPDPRIGINPSYIPPVQKTIEGRNAFEFNRNSSLFGPANNSLNLAGKNFSSFANFSTTSENGSASQPIFTLRQNNPESTGNANKIILSYGIKNSKPYINYLSSSGENIELSGQTELSPSIKWHSIGVVQNAGKVALYLDGNEVAGRSDRVSGFANNTQFVIGKTSESDTTNHFSGHIDDLFVTEAVLSQDEIVKYFTEGPLKTLSSSASKTTCLTVQKTEQMLTLKPGWNVFFSDTAVKFIDTSPILKQGFPLFVFNFTTNQRWTTAQNENDAKIPYLIPGYGYYAYNSSDKKIEVALNKANQSKIKQTEAILKKGWNLLSNNSGADLNLRELTIAVETSKNKTKMSDLIDTKKVYKKVYAITDPSASTADKAFTVINLESQSTIPAKTAYWVYLF